MSAPLEAKREGNKRCNNIAQKSKQKKSNRFVYLLATPRRGSSTIDHPKNHANKFKKRKMRKLSDVKGLKKSRILSNNQRSEVYLSDRSAHVNRELITTGCYLIFYRKKKKANRRIAACNRWKPQPYYGDDAALLLSNISILLEAYRIKSEGLINS